MIKRMPTVSIIIPLFNSKCFFEDTILSAINQSYPLIEIIIVDDFSTDGSFEIAQKYQSYNVILKKNKTKGACAARNYGFELSTGDYIQYLDADDILHPSKIENQLQLFEQFGDEILCSGVWGRFYNSIDTVKWGNQIINKNYDAPVNWLIDSWNGNGMGQTSIWLTHRTLIEKAGEWDESLLLNQDGEFFSRVLLNAKTIKFCEGAKVYYRSGNLNSITRKNSFGELKAISLLHSYHLYEKNCKDYIDSNKLKKSLANNYLSFIYQFYPLFPDLLEKSEESFYHLGFKKMWPVGGEKFKKMARIIGFKNLLAIRELLRKIK
ncbi:glycosyltransferase family 2 protein [uncultured Polaribacter sp.]|uniref:glycosyltransferase family 2 protein n=1 Tax=uncultured Polaribacter sp. TaxID=174711 RepID=UPI00262F7931|nr:glycosyltransferase family 2 protein [uncultured Polaribacter sp.]